MSSLGFIFCQLLSCTTDHTGLYVWGLTFLEVRVYSPTAVELQPFLHELMIRVVNLVGRCTFAYRGVWCSYSLRGN